VVFIGDATTELNKTSTTVFDYFNPILNSLCNISLIVAPCIS